MTHGMSQHAQCPVACGLGPSRRGSRAARATRRPGVRCGRDESRLAPARQPSLVGVVRSRARPAGRPDASPTCPCLSTANVPRGCAARARAGANARGGTAGGSDRDRRWPSPESRVAENRGPRRSEMPPAPRWPGAADDGEMRARRAHRREDLNNLVLIRSRVFNCLLGSAFWLACGLVEGRRRARGTVSGVTCK